MDVAHQLETLAIGPMLRKISVDQLESVEVSMDHVRELSDHRVLRGYLFQSE